MSTNQQPETWDGEIDLGRWLDVLVRFKWVIAGVTVAALAVGIIVNYLVLTPTYQTSAQVSLPQSSGDSRVGLTLPQYQSLAGSQEIMEEVDRRLAGDFAPERLPGYFRFQLDSEAREITATVAAPTEEMTYSLAHTWVQAYSDEVNTRTTQQFEQAEARAREEVGDLRSRRDSARERMTAFNEENLLSQYESRLSRIKSSLSEQDTRFREITSSLPLTRARIAVLDKLANGDSPESVVPLRSEKASGPAAPAPSTPTSSYLSTQRELRIEQQMDQARLSEMSAELVSLETRLRELDYSVIPVAKARLTFLQEALSQEQPAQERYPGEKGSTSAQDPEGGGPNPVYTQLREDVRAAELRLEGKLAEREGLEARIALLQGQIDQVERSLAQVQQAAEAASRQLSASQEADALRRETALDQAEANTMADNITRLRAELQELQRKVSKERALKDELSGDLSQASEDYQTARSSLEDLQALEPRLSALATVNVMEHPSLPADLVSPRRVRNVLLAGVLGLMLGVSSAALLDLSQRRGGASPS